MIVAIHQPNYSPWAGYFRKLADADVFVYLDDAHFPKNSYVNRVRIVEGGNPAWLTIPAKPKLGTPIHDVVSALNNWPARHLSRLRNAYAEAPCFKSIWSELTTLYDSLGTTNLAKSNCALIEWFASKLGFSTRFVLASDFPNPNILRGDDRLINLVKKLDGTVYLSGQGGAEYQDEAKFRNSGIELIYTEFKPSPYRQLSNSFAPGMSILDIAFNLGWEGAAAYVTSTASTS